MSYQICIETGNVPPGEYMALLHFGITEIMKLAYSARELDLRENQTLALHTLSDFLQQLVTKE